MPFSQPPNDLLDNDYAEHRLKMRDQEASLFAPEGYEYDEIDPKAPGKYGKDIAKSIPHGIGQAVTNAADGIAALAASLDLQSPEDPTTIDPEKKKVYEPGSITNPLAALEPETLPGKLTGGIAQFLTGFFPFLKVFRSLGAAGYIGELGAGMAADATVFEPFQDNLANLVDQLPAEIKNPVLRYLAEPVREVGEALKIEQDDDRAEATLKRMAEGLMMASVVDPFIKVLRVIKQSGAGPVVAKKVGKEAVEQTGISFIEHGTKAHEIHMGSVMDPSFPGGGSTYNVRTGESMAGQDAIVVSIYEGRQVKVPGQATSDHVAGYIEMNKDLLLGADSRVNLGTWYDADEGVTFLDVVATVPREHIGAVHGLGREFDQKAAFDLFEGREIPLEGTGKGVVSEIPEAERLAMVPTETTGKLRLQRYVDEPGLEELDPALREQYTGVSAGERGRLEGVLGEGEAGAPERLNWYLESATHEPQVMQGRHLYEAEVPRGRIYNGLMDPLGLRAKATPEGMVRPDANTYERLIKEAGFAGYVDPHLGHAAIWEKLPVKQIERELPPAQAADTIIKKVRNPDDPKIIPHILFTPESDKEVFVDWVQAEPENFRKALRPLIKYLFDNPDVEKVSFTKTEAIERWADKLGATIKEGEVWEVKSNEIMKFLKIAKETLKSEGGFIDFSKPISKKQAGEYAAAGAAYLAKGKRPFNKWVKNLTKVAGEENGMIVREAAEKKFDTMINQAPRWMTRSKKLMEYWESGKHLAEWYNEIPTEMKMVFGDDAEMVTRFLAATSARTSSKANLTLGMKAYRQWVVGGREASFDQFKGFMQAHRENLRLAAGGFELNGPKVKNFEKALGGDLDAVVVDRWMMRAFGFKSETPTDAQYELIEELVRKFAADAGVAPAEFQAGVWVGIKTLDGTRADTADSWKTLITDWLDNNPLWAEELSLGYKPKQPGLGLLKGQVGLAREDLTRVLARIAVGAIGGGAVGETPEDRLRNALIGMGITGMGPPLIRKMASLIRSSRSGLRGVAEEVPEGMGTARKATEGLEGKSWDEVVGMHRVPDEVKGVWDEFNALVNTFEWRAIKAKRGEVRPREMAHFEGELLGWTIDDVKKMTGTLNLSDEQASALINVMKNAGDATIKAARKWMETEAPEDLQGFLRLYNTFLEMDPKRLAGKAEAGRSLGILNDPLAGYNRYLDQFAGTAEMGTHVGPNRLAQMVAELGDAEQMARAFHRGAKPGMGDVLLEMWINGLLSGPSTHAVNFMGNATTMFWVIPERAIASRIGRSVHKGEATAMMFGMTHSIMDAWKLAARAFKEGRPVSGLQKIETRFRKAISSETFGMEGGVWASFVDYMGEAIRLPGRFLLAGDEFAKTINSRMQAYALAYREGIGQGLKGKKFAEYIKANLDNLPSKIKEGADEFAAVQTFTNELGGFGQALSGIAESSGFVRIIMPFVKTPINIFKYVTERLPMTAPFYKTVRADIAAGGVRRDMALAKMATGGMTMAMFATLAASGHITGRGPKNKVLKQAWEADGKREYSIYIPVIDQWVSYKRLDPVGMIMGLSADFVTGCQQADAETYSEMAETVAGAAWISLVRNLSSKTYLKGVSDAVEAITSEEPDAVNKWLRQFTGSFVPAIVAQATRQLDDQQREAHTIMEKFLSRTPWLSKEIPPRRNIFGEIQHYTGALGPDWISPFYTSDKKDPDPVMKEINKNETEVMMPPWAIDGIKISSKQRDNWIVLMNEVENEYGLTMKEQLKELINSEEYKEATEGPDGIQSAMIKKVIYTFKGIAYHRLRDKDEELDQKLRKQEVEDLQAKWGDQFSPADYMEAIR